MIEMAAPPSTAAQAMMIHTLEPMDPARLASSVQDRTSFKLRAKAGPLYV